MRKVLVTGATGFLGLHLTRALSDRGDSVIGLIHDGHAGIERPLVDWVFGDVSDIRLLERAISDYECDTVVHLAAITQVSVAEADPVSVFEANVRGTWNVMEACRRQKVARIIVASTDKAYGSAPSPYTEDTPLCPDHPYETSKACADMIARSYSTTYGMSVSVTRSVNLYGPGHLNWSTLIPGTIRRLAQNTPVLLRGGGKMSRDFLFVADVVNGYLRLIDSDYVGPICFGTGICTMIVQVVDKIQRIMGISLSPTCVPGDAKGEIQTQSSQYRIAYEKLGWAPTHSLKEGLEETVPWYLDYLGVAPKVQSK